MEWAWTSAENELNRYADMAIANLNADTQTEVAKRGETTAAGTAIGSLIGTLGSAYIMSTFLLGSKRSLWKRTHVGLYLVVDKV